MENTPNIGLKRWEGGDRVLHSEFNDNWDKLDEAIAGKVPMTVLYDKTLERKETRIELAEIPDQHWEQYTFVLLTYTPGPEHTHGWSFFTIGSRDEYATHQNLLRKDANVENGIFRAHAPVGVSILFFTNGNRDRLQAVSFDGTSLYHGTSSYGYTLPITVSGEFDAGDRLRICGIL